MRITVIGGSGLIGSKLVEKLRRGGHEVVAADVRGVDITTIDLLTGKGLAAAVAGSSVVVDVSNSPSFDAAPALHFFDTSTRNVLAAEAAAGVQHHVALSVVGTDRMLDNGYFRAKHAQERLIEAASIPYTIVHATQFFEFVRRLADNATKDGVVRVPPVLIQPMAADDVASALVHVATNRPLDGMVEIAGPETMRFAEMIQRSLSASNDARKVVEDPDTLVFGGKVTERTLLAGGDANPGQTRFGDWLGRPSKAA